jgi:hypothetical protein
MDRAGPGPPVAVILRNDAPKAGHWLRSVRCTAAISPGTRRGGRFPVR